MRFITAGYSNTGGRENNEDYIKYIYEEDKYGCWVVADGLGGHLGGDVVSRLAAESLMEAFSSSPGITEEGLLEHIRAAQEVLLREQKRLPRLAKMRTTIVVLASDCKSAAWAHIGDSRLYYFSGKSIVLQTRDHSVSQSAVDIGVITAAEIRGHEDRNKLYRVLGVEDSLKPSILKAPVELKQGDAFLLCTDGFWEYVLEAEMEQELKASGTPEEWLEGMLKRQRGRAPANCDNYSAICIFAY